MESSLREPKSVQIMTQNKVEKAFIISKFPTILGREIIAKYPLSSLPKVGDYNVSEETMLKLMTCVAIPMESGNPLRLSTRELVENHVPDWETLVKIEAKMLEYNTSFFEHGLVQGFIDHLLQKLAPILSQTLTLSLQALSKLDTQLIPNSETK